MRLKHSISSCEQEIDTTHPVDIPVWPPYLVIGQSPSSITHHSMQMTT
jgi:hypothetical protein